MSDMDYEVAHGIAQIENAKLRAEIERLRALLAKEPCPYCTGKFTGLPNNACENCMNTGSKYPEYVEALGGK